MRIALVAVGLALVAAACSSGPDAPFAGDTEIACADTFCVEYPSGWEVEEGADFLSFRHPLAPEVALATVGFVNMEGVASAAGAAWPAPTEDVVRALWTLLAEGGDVELATVVRGDQGDVRSFGSFGGGRLWHLLRPVDGERAVGIEVRGPNSSWEVHAEVFFDGLTLTP